MKNINLVKVISIVTLIPAFVIVSAQECPEYISHYWSLESNSNGFADRINGIDAQVEVEPTTVTGIVNSGQYFNGLSELNVPDVITFDWLNNGSFTIEFWINKTTACPDLLKEFNNVVIGRDDAGTQLHWWVGINCQAGGKANFTLESIDGSSINLVGKDNIIDGQWHLIVATREGGTKTTSLYVDGVKDTSTVFTYSTGFASQAPINIGWLNLDDKYHLDATLDELAIYNGVLPAATIVDHFNSGSGKDYCTGVVTKVNDMQSDAIGFDVYPTVTTSDIRVTFNLDKPQPVQLSLFDVTGRKITDLLNERLNQGTHHLNFSLHNIDPHSMVLVQLKVAEQVVTKKIMVE